MINSTEVMLLVTLLIIGAIVYSLYINRNKSRLHKLFLLIFVLLSIEVTGFILQIIFSKTNISLMKFEYIIYIGMTFIPVISLFIALVFINPKVNLRRCWWFYVIPVITNILLWTNKYHNLIFVKYSTDLVQTKYGNWFNFVYAPTYYIYLCITIFILIRGSIKKSGFFSIQTGLIVLGAMIPIVINFVGLLKIIPMTIYITPISMIFTVICFSLAIFKYKALNITPIAFRTVINTMSDAFIVISDDGTIVDKNLTFENTFGGILKANTDDNLFEMIEKSNLLDLKNLKIHIGETRKEKKIINEEYHIVNGNFNRYFQVDIHPIKAKQITQYIGTLLLFKDITEHKNDIKVIEDKQEVIVKQGQLVSIGELAGGVAHDINTPISAIKTGIQLLQEMYVPRDDTEKELLIRMSNCTEKIIKIVNSMRNQIRNLGSDQKSNFKISEVIEDVRIIAYNEFQKNKCELIINIEDDLSVYGDPTKLGQVFTNLFLNAIQAYNEQPGKIEVSVSKAPNNKVMVKVRDYAGGIPEKIKEFVFKNILTTKGTKGTGLGLYLAYSVIKGEFSGDITFESSEGQGTTFYIILDRAKEEIKNVVQKV